MFPDVDERRESSRSIDLAPLPSLVLRWSLAITAALTIAHVAATDFVFVDLLGLDEDNSARAVRNLFRLPREQSLPTWFSVVLLLACAAVLLLISSRTESRKGPKRAAWLSLEVIFLAMSIDEQIGTHEVLSIYLSDVLKTGGVLRYAWVIPGSMFVAVVAYLSWRSFRQLPGLYIGLFFGAGAIYVSGALLAEMFEALVVTDESAQLELGVSYVLQDPLEMAGAAVFLYALVRYCVNQLGWRRLTLDSQV